MVKKLIIADDSQTVRTSLRYMVQDLVPDTEIDEVENGADLVRKVQENPLYDLVLTDKNMPIKNGLEAIREIRMSGNSLLPIYLLSSEIEDVSEQALQAGATGYFNKQDKEVQVKLGEVVRKYLS